MTGDAVRVLIHAPNWLGDLVMSTVLIERAYAAGLRPHVLVRRRWAPLLDGDPRLGGVMIYERSGRHRGLRGSLSLAREVGRAGDFAAVFVLPPSWRAAAVARIAGQGPRIGFRGEGRGPLLDQALDRGARGVRHFCDEIDELWRAYAPETQGPTPTPSVQGGAGAVPGTTEPRRWVLAVGATYGSAKVWPPALAAEFCRRACELGVRVELLGDGASRDHVAAMRAATELTWRQPDEAGPGVVDRVGGTDLGTAAGVLAEAGAFVGNDSGLMHLSAALGTPTLGLFGSSNPGWTAPRGRRTGFLAVEGFPCSPCHRRRCREDRFCMETLTPERVLTEVLRLEGLA